MLKNKKGFTLIELLIVIVIIGILVAVTIAVINPSKQRNRARDAGVEATMNKIALSVSGYRSAYDSYPDCADFFAGIDGVTSPSGVAGAYSCTFRMDAVDGATAANGYDWKYVANNSASVPYFTLSHRSFGLAEKDLVYSSLKSGIIYQCALGETDVNASTCKRLTAQ